MTSEVTKLRQKYSQYAREINAYSKHWISTLMPQRNCKVLIVQNPSALEERVSSPCKWSSCLFSIWLWHRLITFLSRRADASQSVTGESISSSSADGDVFDSTVDLRVSRGIVVKSTHAQSKRKMILGLHADEERSSQETQKSSQISCHLFWTALQSQGILQSFLVHCLTEIITSSGTHRCTYRKWSRKL